ncbi:nitrogenase iron-molybdenum cofactor biosynthesis protein NifE [Anaerotalea alkaliphila]|uniref:Nitrogenase iron-molybdenum cofactor biosynthesis protein NifE n=1 Tax=Anaerotalea alkaliphila TaxID=2662126 RepID=A0A7X5KLA6_9FIRM|nr:nitrogenase iron-molybdenum cofactor biosynthesis protein NifE [Anaerotalea alkaliphila]NDL66499.1 nitrogenase iron-molybdenum cofactor biosynthesis protein NifE [Anaerotalea alkaliphila]
METASVVIKERERSVHKNGMGQASAIECDTSSVSGVVSQRACVYCGARVVLNPVTDAAHIVHGPIGCAAYTWDIRGSLSSKEELYRNSFSTDLREEDIVFGGEMKLAAAIDGIVEKHSPKAVFVYSTCVVGVIGDDVEAVCRMAEKKHDIPVLPVNSPGFSGNKKDGYKAACNTMLRLMGETAAPAKAGGGDRPRLNFLGDFNLAAEAWIIKGYLEELGIQVVTCITGDATVQGLRDATRADLNIVQCAGSMTYLAKRMEERYGIPYTGVRFLGLSDTIASLEKIVGLLGDAGMEERLERLVARHKGPVEEALGEYRPRLEGKRAALYVGGGFKATSLIAQFGELGIETVLVGTQTGSREEYEHFKTITGEGTVILDDTNPSELEHFIRETGAEILVGGVKERPLAYKLGLAFVDHNHERKHPLAGFEGALNLAKEIDGTVNSPVWRHVKKEVAR